MRYKHPNEHGVDVAPSSPGRTLLPPPIATAVSFATRSTSLALRVGTLIGGYGFDAARVTTLSSLELGRGMLEGILSRAGRDVISRSGPGLGRADAETVLERSLEHLHRTMTQLVFWTATGFHMTGTTLAVISETSQILLATLDQFLGSTESSRAMASIITLIRREFRNPATGVQGEKVGVVDLMLGLCGMAYLQRWCRRLLEEESRSLHIEETVWDVVVLSDGVRVDLHEESLYGVHNGRYNAPRGIPNDHRVMPGAVDTAAEGRIAASIEQHGGRDSDNEDDGLPEIRLKRQIMKSLANNARVSITTSVATTKTITVDIAGPSQSLPLPPPPPPPGVELVEETRDVARPSSLLQLDSQGGSLSPTCRVVYRLKRNTERRTSFRKEDGDISQIPGYVELDDDDDDDDDGDDNMVVDVSSEASPVLPPRAFVVASQEGGLARRPSSSTAVASGSSSLLPKPLRVSSTAKHGPENTANQKKPRVPLTFSSSPNNGRPLATARRQSLNRLLTGRIKGDVSSSTKATEKKAGFRSALKRPMSTFLSKDDSGSETCTPINAKSKQGRPDLEPSVLSRAKTQLTGQTRPTPGRRASVTPSQDAARSSQRILTGQSSRVVGTVGAKGSDEPYTRSSSRASYISVHERRRDSLVSQTDTYSITTADDYRPVSPCAMRGENPPKSGSPMAKSRSEKDVPGFHPASPLKVPRRVRSHVYSPSIYTLKNDSRTSLVPYALFQRSAFGDSEALHTLRRDGMVDGMFPRHHLLRNITRYMRFASASYGSHFLKVMGISKEMPILRALDDTHHELRHFAHHTESDASSILLSSFVDAQGGSDATGSTNTGVPLVHYISLDHESKAVVLACRGTLGFEDVLADMTCDYDDLVWRGKPYKVHKGIHASARRLLYGGDGRVLLTLKQALEEFSDYGLVLTGHSLGGAVTALLGVMLSEPAPGTCFMTSSEPHAQLTVDNGMVQSAAPLPRHICLPPGRPIHVFAYGPPSTMSSSLRMATRGLITSIVNNNDLVPYLSLGVLHDFQAVALAFKTDNHEAKVEVRQRIWEGFQTGIADRWWYRNRGSKHASREDDQWAYAALKVLRASMMSQKLLPPGEVFVVEKTRVLRREAFLRDGEDHFARPAQRVVLKYIRDVEQRFREVRFGTSMLTDHSPGQYEDALDKLKTGVLGLE
ncbi:hypothetical protein QBC46DRAFT_416725 [Diplogelasinospora grovesii]|uniref:sn-1-specific diacylglycerol lipase n=1 Tax=Diplogelasinospora grovesii TaxID=303347 RepID=A0AAN6S8H0_9PEZI|nr:hypothetical protein QBC46DRAFT_416725 [Diplogelasinospora grovesii]